MSIYYFLGAFVAVVVIITILEFTPSARAEKKRRKEEADAETKAFMESVERSHLR